MVVLEYLRSHRRIAVVTHELADVDAAASAAAVAILARSAGAQVDVLTPGGATRPARLILERFSVPFTEDPSVLLSADAVILVDAPSPARAGRRVEELISSRALPALIVDHHPAAGGPAAGATALVDEGASSTSEVLAKDIMGSMGGAWDGASDAACALGLGILADTGRLRNAGCGTLEVYSALCRVCGRPPGPVSSGARRDVSEVIAVLKGLRALRILEAGGWIIAASIVGGQQASVAAALVRVGADLGIALGRAEGGGSEGSMRASRALSSSGLRLGDLARELARELGGSGGGHAAAASFRVRAGPGAAMDAILRLLSASLNSTPREIVRACPGAARTRQWSSGASHSPIAAVHRRRSAASTCASRPGSSTWSSGRAAAARPASSGA